MKIHIDSREYFPLDFSQSPGVETLSTTLCTGDYSADGLQNLIAFERKSLSDLVACTGPEREWFERELQRGRGLECFGVVIEADMAAVANHAYRSRTSPASVIQSILTFSIRYGTHFLWCGTRDLAAYVVYSLLQKFVWEAQKRYEAVLDYLGGRTAVKPVQSKPTEMQQCQD